MKTLEKKAIRQAQWLGIILWSAHYHNGQWSQEYRMGCRARALFVESMEIGEFVLSRCFDKLEHYVSSDSAEMPAAISLEYAETVKTAYNRLVAIG